MLFLMPNQQCQRFFNTTQLLSITEHKQASITANNTSHIIKCAAALNSINTIHAAKTPTKATDTVQTCLCQTASTAKTPVANVHL